ncbi:MAG: hypothetical protein ABIO39_11335 [Caulobacteraceae bacterium]
MAMLAVAGLLAFDAASETSIMHSELNVSRLERPKRPGVRRIVVLGSSKTECAFAYDADMEARFRRAGQSVAFTRIAMYGAPPHQMAYSFDAVLKSRPDLVLLESDVLLLEPGGYNVRDLAIEPSWQSRSRAELKALIGLKSHTPNDAAAAAPCDASISQRPLPTVSQFAVALRKRKLSTPAERRAYLDFMTKLRAQGAEVGLIDIPLAPEIERVIPARLVHDRAVLNDRLIAERGLIHMTPGLLPKPDYVDWGHLNAGGRDRFTGWFITEAAKRLRPAHA